MPLLGSRTAGLCEGKGTTPALGWGQSCLPKISSDVTAPGCGCLEEGEDKLGLLLGKKNKTERRSLPLIWSPEELGRNLLHIPAYFSPYLS